MKKIAMTMMAVALVAGAASAADVSIGVDFASAYVFRGVTLNDGFVAQPWGEVSGFPIDEKYGSIAFGIWGNYDIDDLEGQDSDMSEVDYYVVYTLPVTNLDISVSYTEYTYEQGDSDKEVGLSIGTGLGDTGLYASLAANYGVGGAVDESWYFVAGLDYEQSLSEALTLSAGVTVAYALVEDAEDGFNDATAGLGLSYALNENWSVGGSVTYIAQLDDDVLTDDAYDVDLLGMISIGCDF